MNSILKSSTYIQLKKKNQIEPISLVMKWSFSHYFLVLPNPIALASFFFFC